MLDAKLYCVFFFWYFISCIRKKKAFILCLVVDSKPWGFYQPFIVPVYAFSVVFAFFTEGEKQLHCQTSLLDIDWDIYSAHAFASLMYTNWLISNQNQSSTLYTWSAFVSQSVCAGAFGFIVVVNSFVVGLFLFFEPVTIRHRLRKKSAHVMVLLWIWRAAWKNWLAFEDCILKTELIWVFFF